MIDVIIPCRNAPEALWLTLVHFWAQAYYPSLVESVILIDNASTDSRVQTILRYAVNRYPATHQVVLNERNVGVWCSINRGLLCGQADFAFILTSDVLLCRDALQDVCGALQREPTLGILGPEVVTGLSACPALALPPDTVTVDRSTYNGAAWMLRRSLLQQVGWYDPRFYVAYGDTDYMERLRMANVGYGVLRGVPCVHLDKQSRRADGTAIQDSEVELQDARAFAAKWREHPEIVRRHTPGQLEHLVAWKEQDLGGWEAARVR